MAVGERIVKNYVYDGLGFPIVLDRVVLKNIRGNWLPKVDMDHLASIVISLLPSRYSKLTGNEINFIRVFLNESKSSFGKIFKVSHSAVAKWEKSQNQPAAISSGQEMALRLYLLDFLNLGEEKFYKTYKIIESSVYNEEDIPLKVAL